VGKTYPAATAINSLCFTTPSAGPPLGGSCVKTLLSRGLCEGTYDNAVRESFIAAAAMGEESRGKSREWGWHQEWQSGRKGDRAKAGTNLASSSRSQRGYAASFSVASFAARAGYQETAPKRGLTWPTVFRTEFGSSALCVTLAHWDVR